MTEVKLTDQNFESEVQKSTIPVLVDFYAEWCGPCQMLNPILEEIDKEYGGKIKIGKLNVDENPASAAKYSVMSIPTLILFNGGKVIKQMMGVQSKEILVSELNKLLQ